MTEQVPFFEFREFKAGVQQQIEQVLLQVARQKNFILGQEVSEFEAYFASFLSNQVVAVGVGNGYDALVIALKALNIKAGDEVLVPSNSYMATINAVLQANAKPVLVEPCMSSYNVTAADLEKKISAKTKAILPVHLYGQACQISEIMELAQQYKLYVVEDCAQAHAATYKGRHVGTFGHAAAFSFYPTKNLGAMGDGGAVVTGSKAVAQFVKQYRNYGQKEKYVGELVGVNSRLDEIQAAILRVKLQHLQPYNLERQRLASIYLSELADTGDLILPYSVENCGHVYHLFNIRTNHRDQLQSWLKAHKVQTAIHYPVPVHLQPAYSFIGYQAGSFPIAEELASTSLSLPLFPGLTEQEQEQVISAVKGFFTR